MSTVRERRSDIERALAANVSERQKLTTQRQQLVGVALRVWAVQDTYAAVEAYAGTPDEACAQMSEMFELRQLCVQAVNKADLDRATGLDMVRDVARDEQWSSVVSPIREQCRTAEVAVLAGAARGWVAAIEVRCRSIDDDLNSLNRHRDLLVKQLEELCATQRRLLSEVTSASRLPLVLGGALAGQPAFKVDFTKLGDERIRDRLSERVDDWAARLTGATQTRLNRETRIRWLAEAVRDTVEHTANGAWRVKVLKPPVDDRVEYRTPDRVAKEYSGGQELTLAVLLYCTLAAVRAKNRTSGARPPGVLLIDNPFGRASNAQLIRMQQTLASQSGVQLICATGIDDPAVLAAFEGDTGRVVRLRNDRDQRRGYHHLRISDPQAAALLRTSFGADRAVDDDTDRLSALGYTVRDPETVAGG